MIEEVIILDAEDLIILTLTESQVKTNLAELALNGNAPDKSGVALNFAREAKKLHREGWEMFFKLHPRPENFNNASYDEIGNTITVYLHEPEEEDS